MTTEDAKAYLATREVPRLFECLMTGLMFHRPDDHVQYLIDTLKMVKAKGQEAVTWNMFVEVRSSKTPLPPITSNKAKRSTSSDPDDQQISSATTSPLPPIGSAHLISVPIIFIVGGPCSGKSAQADRLAQAYPGWVSVNTGALLRAQTGSRDSLDNWRTVRDLMLGGELAPAEVTLKLLTDCIQKNRSAVGFLVHGFPRNLAQAELFESNSRVDAVLLIDCEEDRLTLNAFSRVHDNERPNEAPNAFERRMSIFKEETLPMLKYYDDGGKLYIVDGDQDEDAVYQDLSAMFESLLLTMDNGRLPTPPPGSRPPTGRFSRKTATPTAPSVSPPASPLQSKLVLKTPVVRFIPPPEIRVKDEGRKHGLPNAPVIFLAGGPGSGKGVQGQKLAAWFPHIVHLSLEQVLYEEIERRGTVEDKWTLVMNLLQQGDIAPLDVTVELLIQSMREHPDAGAYLVDGFPKDALQYEEFNRQIGGHLFTILLDCESQTLHDRLIARGGESSGLVQGSIPALEKKLEYFAQKTIPLLKSIEDEGKLIVIDGDRDEDEVFLDIVEHVEVKVNVNDESKGNEVEHLGFDEEEDEDQVEEESFVAEKAALTGDGDEVNPEYSRHLDSLDTRPLSTESQPQSLDEWHALAPLTSLISLAEQEMKAEFEAETDPGEEGEESLLEEQREEIKHDENADDSGAADRLIETEKNEESTEAVVTRAEEIVSSEDVKGTDTSALGEHHETEHNRDVEDGDGTLEGEAELGNITNYQPQEVDNQHKGVEERDGTLGDEAEVESVDDNRTSGVDDNHRGTDQKGGDTTKLAAAETETFEKVENSENKAAKEETIELEANEQEDISETDEQEDSTHDHVQEDNKLKD